MSLLFNYSFSNSIQSGLLGSEILKNHYRFSDYSCLVVEEKIYSKLFDSCVFLISHSFGTISSYLF